jgi:hypothetical protein
MSMDRLPGGARLSATGDRLPEKNTSLHLYLGRARARGQQVPVCIYLSLAHVIVYVVFSSTGKEYQILYELFIFFE